MSAWLAQNVRARSLAGPRRYGAGEKSRTPDLRITNALLYQLSYTGVSRAYSRAAKPAFYFRSKRPSFFATATFFSVT